MQCRSRIRRTVSFSLIASAAAFAAACARKPEQTSASTRSASAAEPLEPKPYPRASWRLASLDDLNRTVIWVSHVVVAHPSVPASNLKELIDYAKKNPGQLSYASPGSGSPQHLAAETIKQSTGIDLAHIPYKGGGQAIGDVVGGQVKLGVLGMAPVIPHYKAGKLKILAVTGAQRSPLLPDIPTVAESGVPGFATSQWTGIVAPAGTPQEVITRVHAALATILRQPAVIEKITALGQEASASATPGEFQQMIRAEIKRWPSVVAAAGVKPE